jgi:hypothetical protein
VSRDARFLAILDGGTLHVLPLRPDDVIRIACKKLAGPDLDASAWKIRIPEVPWEQRACLAGPAITASVTGPP